MIVLDQVGGGQVPTDVVFDEGVGLDPDRRAVDEDDALSGNVDEAFRRRFQG